MSAADADCSSASPSRSPPLPRRRRCPHPQQQPPQHVLQRAGSMVVIRTAAEILELEEAAAAAAHEGGSHVPPMAVPGRRREVREENTGPEETIVARFECDAFGVVTGINRDVTVLLHGNPRIRMRVTDVSHAAHAACVRRFVGGNIDVLMPESMREMHRRLVRIGEAELRDAATVRPELRWSTSSGHLDATDWRTTATAHRRCVSHTTALTTCTASSPMLAERLQTARQIVVERPDGRRVVVHLLVVAAAAAKDGGGRAYTVMLSPVCDVFTPNAMLSNLVPHRLAEHMMQGAARKTWLDASTVFEIDYQAWTPFLFLDICGSTRFAREHTPREVATMHRTLFTLVERVRMAYSHQIHKLELVGDALVAVSVAATDPRTAPSLCGSDVCIHDGSSGSSGSGSSGGEEGGDGGGPPRPPPPRRSPPAACTIETCEMLWRRMRRCMECRVMARFAVQVMLAVKTIFGAPDTAYPGLNIRIGMNCGEVTATVFERNAALHFYGITVPATARLEQNAEEGTILTSAVMLQRMDDDLIGHSIHDALSPKPEQERGEELLQLQHRVPTAATTAAAAAAAAAAHHTTTPPRIGPRRDIGRLQINIPGFNDNTPLSSPSLMGLARSRGQRIIKGKGTAPMFVATIALATDPRDDDNDGDNEDDKKMDPTATRRFPDPIRRASSFIEGPSSRGGSSDEDAAHGDTPHRNHTTPIFTERDDSMAITTETRGARERRLGADRIDRVPRMSIDEARMSGGVSTPTPTNNNNHDKRITALIMRSDDSLLSTATTP